MQRPLWASTSTKNPAYPDTLYVDQLIGPDTVNTLPEITIANFEDHGTIARTIDQDLGQAAEHLERLERLGIDMTDVGLTLETQGVAAFHQSFAHVLNTLEAKARQLVKRGQPVEAPPPRRGGAAAEGQGVAGADARRRPARRRRRVFRPVGDDLHAL